MLALNFELPIYWTQTYKTKPDKTSLVGMNFYRNAHYHAKNQLKKDLEQHLKDSFNGPYDKIIGQYVVHYTLYYKNPSCDASNIIALSEKIFLDFIQDIDIVEQDSVKYHISSSWEVAKQDKINPRVEITLKPKE